MGVGDYDTLKDMVDFDHRIQKEIYYTELQIQSNGGHIRKRKLKRKFMEVESYPTGRCTYLVLENKVTKVYYYDLLQHIVTFA